MVKNGHLEIASMKGRRSAPEWPALLRKLDRLDPSDKT
jgi:hypothetical protein